MTLLYEAALKTNPDVEEPKDRPAAINPTAGVEPRSAVGRAVWIKDDTRKGGGIWVTRTDQERRDAGVPPDDCLLESELEPGSHLAQEWAIAQGQGTGETIRSFHTGNGTAARPPQQQLAVPGAAQAAEVGQILAPVRGQLIPPIAPLSGSGATFGMPPGGVPDLPAQETLSDIQSGTNVNPSMNFGQMFSDTTVVGPGSEITTVCCNMPTVFGAWLMADFVPPGGRLDGGYVPA